VIKINVEVPRSWTENLALQPRTHKEKIADNGACALTSVGIKGCTGMRFAPKDFFKD
jgi:hypothetical protein